MKRSRTRSILSVLDARVAGLERHVHASRPASEPPRKAGLPPSMTSSPPSFSDDIIECNGWPATTLCDNVKGSLAHGIEATCKVVVLRKYGDRALVQCDDYASGVVGVEGGSMLPNTLLRTSRLLLKPDGDLVKNTPMMNGFGSVAWRSCRSRVSPTLRRRRAL